MPVSDASSEDRLDSPFLTVGPLPGGDPGSFSTFVQWFRTLIGDRRTWRTMKQVLLGVIGACSLCANNIAAAAPGLADKPRGERRVRRLIQGESTKRSRLGEKDLIERLRLFTLRFLLGVTSVRIALDTSDWRKPWAQEVDALMKVRPLRGGKLIPGYETLTAIAITPEHRGVLYHHLFSSNEDGFSSLPSEVRTAIRVVGETLAPAGIEATWLLDRGFDDLGVWHPIWTQDDHVVSRLCHMQRHAHHRNDPADHPGRPLSQYLPRLTPLALVHTEMQVQRGKRRRKEQVKVVISASPLELRYEVPARLGGQGEQCRKAVWLVQVKILDTATKPWYLLTDLPVGTKEEAEDIFIAYRQRWTVEDAFRFVKDSLAGESVQSLDLRGVRAAVALAWVAAGFLYQMGPTLEDEGVQLLARLGGWEPRPKRPPGKLVLTRGLRRLINALGVMEALDAYRQSHDGQLPPQIQEWIDLAEELGD